MSGLRSKTGWLLLIASLAFNAGMGTTFGIRAFRHYGEREEAVHGCRNHAFLERLKLPPDQHAHIEAQSYMLHAKTRELHQALKEESAVLADLLVAVKPDREVIAVQLEKLAELHRLKQQQVVEHFLRLSELLENDQREVFEKTIRAVFARCGAEHSGHRKHHGAHPPGGSHKEGPWHDH